MSWTIGEILDNVAARNRRYTEAIDAEDDVGAIIRGLIYVDDNLRSLISLRVPKPREMQLHRMHGKRLVELAEGLGLIDAALAKSLRAFVELRNAFAHQLDRQLKESDVDSIIRTFDETLLDHYHVLVGNHADRDNLPGRMRFAIHSLNEAIFELEVDLAQSP